LSKEGEAVPRPYKLKRMLTLVYHLPWPGLGHFAKEGDGFRFVAEPMQVVL
jgi:hypothetical protein